MLRRITKAEVAKAAGVARSAASMVLNGRPHTLSRTTVRRILRAAADMGYRQASRPDVRCVAFIAQGEHFYDRSDDLFQRVARAVMSELAAREYNVVAGFLEGRDAPGVKLPRVLREGGVDGFVVLVADRAGYDAVRAPLDRLGTRAVFAAWKCEGVAKAGWVTNDDPGGSRDAAERVARFGHRRVAILSAVGTGNPAARERLEGFREGLAAHGIEVLRRRIADGGWTRDDGRHCMREILDRGRPYPTAVLCSNDWQALGAMDEARRRGISVPARMSFVGFDGCRIAIPLSSPPLTTVAHDLEALGTAAARALTERVERREDDPPRCRIPTKFLDGGTLGPAPAENGKGDA